MIRIAIIIGSTRPGRNGEAVAKWVYEIAQKRTDAEFELVDIKDFNLPLLDEPNHPRLQKYTKAHTEAWSATVDSADAVVIVTAEYNYGYPAALKNAIDYLHHEWRYKPVGFVSYGGVAAGTRAVQQLKQVVGAVQMLAVANSVNIPFVTQFLDDDRVIQANDVMVKAAADMLDELSVVSAALEPLRSRAR